MNFNPENSPASSSVNKKLLEKLEKRKTEGTFRRLFDLNDKLDFYSNDYLGFAKIATANDFQELFSGTGSRLISGSNQYTKAAEVKLATHFETQAALIFNSGYDANLGFFSCIPQKDDTVIYDEFIHASIRDGLKLSNARSYSFRHNDLNDLEKKLKSSLGDIFVSVEGLYSMSGDLALLGPISELCQAYNAKLIVDEAHSAGIYGDLGKGLTHALGIEVFARTITFGKAYGSHGGAIVGDSDLIDYLINFSRPFIYSTALPPESYIRIAEMLDHQLLNYRRSLLQSNISYFRNNFKHEGLISEINSPIQILKIGNVHYTKVLAEELQQLGFALKAIYHPTVPIGSEGIRICIHADNTLSDLNKICEALNRHY